MKKTLSFLSLALLVPALSMAMDGSGPKATSWAKCVAEWRAHTPLLTGAAVGASLALGGKYIPGGLTSFFNDLAPEVKTLTLTAGAGAAAQVNHTVLDVKAGTTSLRDWAAVGGTAVVTFALVSQVAARFSAKAR